ncbi:5048_t:CDS:2, partial [Cetraspora pellucida]
MCSRGPYDSDMLKIWQNTIPSQKTTPQDDINPILEKDINLMLAPINLCHNNHENAYLNITITENPDPLESAGGTVLTGIAAVNICGSTIYFAYGFSFDESLNTHSNLSEETSNNSTLFARINILFASDFMQLPLVLDKALYMPEKITYSPPVENEPSKGTKRK